MAALSKISIEEQVSQAVPVSELPQLSRAGLSLLALSIRKRKRSLLVPVRSVNFKFAAFGALRVVLCRPGLAKS